jgi:hypothetical protein
MVEKGYTPEKAFRRQRATARHVPVDMSIGRSLLRRLFDRPRGLLDIQPQDRVLEIGFGPGVGIELLARAAQRVAGVDPLQRGPSSTPKHSRSIAGDAATGQAA